MSDPITVSLFAEDNAHESLLRPLIERIAEEQGKHAHVRTASARGGHPRALTEFAAYQAVLARGVSGPPPNLVVVAIDANCGQFAAAHKGITSATRSELHHICVPACPDPHIERWYLADLQAFHKVVGVTPLVPRDKCERDIYKRILDQAVRDAGHPATLRGIEFAADLVKAMDLSRAGQSESSLGHFVNDLRGRLKLL